MSAGMADIIAAHRIQFECMGGWEDDRTWLECSCRDLSNNDWSGDTEAEHAAHVAEELTKAGYGLLPDVAPEYGARVMLVNGLSEEPQPQGPNPNPSWFSKSTHVRLVSPWQELQSLPDPLAAALNDPEGHALVQAIHDRKAER